MTDRNEKRLDGKPAVGEWQMTCAVGRAGWYAALHRYIYDV